MQEEGLIERKVALLNHKRLGFGITVFVDIKLSAHGRGNLDDPLPFDRDNNNVPDRLQARDP